MARQLRTMRERCPCQRLRVHVLAVEDAALPFVAREHHALVSARGFARGGVVRAHFRGGRGARGQQQDSERDCQQAQWVHGGPGV